MTTPADPTAIRRIVLDGTLSLRAARAATTDALLAARADGSRKLLLEFHHWQGDEPLSLAFRLDSIHEWARAAPAGAAVAMVLPTRLMDPERIGSIIGQRLGFNCGAFDSVEEALAWLERESVFAIDVDGG